jgi:hypothetical protein
MKHQSNLWPVAAKAFFGIAAFAVMTFPARLSAITITGPLLEDLNKITSEYVVGYAADSGTASEATETTIAQYLLDLPMAFGPAKIDGVSYPLGGSLFKQGQTTVVVDGVTYATNSDFDYSGTIEARSKSTSLQSATGPGGEDLIEVGGFFDYVLAKYDGPAAGLVLYKLDGAEFSYIPEFSNNFWGDGSNLALSHWIGFDVEDTIPPPVPEGTSTLLLLGIAFGFIGVARAGRSFV